MNHLDTPGGHMLMCLVIVLLGATFHLIGVPKGEDLIISGSGALLFAMKNARDKDNG